MEIGNIIHYFWKFLPYFQLRKSRYSASNWHRKIYAVTSPCKCHGWPRRLQSDLCTRPRMSYCVVGDLTARLWWPYGNSTALFSERRCHGICYEHASVGDQLRSQSIYLRCHCVAVEMLEIALRAPPRSAFFLGRRGIAVKTLLWFKILYSFCYGHEPAQFLS